MDQSILELIPVDGSRYGDGRVLVVEQLQEAHDEKIPCFLFWCSLSRNRQCIPRRWWIIFFGSAEIHWDQRLRRHGDKPNSLYEALILDTSNVLLTRL